MAADSLAVNNDTGTPNYSYCKIAAFGHKLVFTSVGSATWFNPSGQGPVQSWDNIELARNAFHSIQEQESATDLGSIRAQWAEDVKGHWNLIDRFDRQRAINIAAANYGQFTAGIFIGKGLEMKFAAIKYNVNKLIDPIEIAIADGDAITPCWPCGQLQGRKICGAGLHLDVAAKFCSERRHGDRIDIRTRLRGASVSTKLAVKIVEMTIDAYEKTAGDVGGKVDTITITKDGSPTWNSLKDGCPDNQD